MATNHDMNGLVLVRIREERSTTILLLFTTKVQRKTEFDDANTVWFCKLLERCANHRVVIERTGDEKL